MAPLPADPAPTASPDAAFAALRKRFVAGLPQRWDEIANASDAERRVAALHRLAGAAGSFDCQAIGEAARAAEQAAARGDAAALEQALALLRLQLAQACDTLR